MSLRAFHKPEILRILAGQLIIVAAMAEVTGLDQQKTETTDRVSHIKAGYEVEEDVVDSNLVQIGFRHVLFHFMSFSYIRVADHLLTTEVRHLGLIHFSIPTCMRHQVTGLST
ncbi:hypothetical protein Tco_0174381, partial [Tanacetum coccineum]